VHQLTKAGEQGKKRVVITNVHEKCYRSLCEQSVPVHFRKKEDLSGDGILEHQVERRLKSFAPCYSQSLSVADFTEIMLYSGLNSIKKSESIHE
jgi:hypothetical protein